jgi:antirestriction protein
MTADSTARLYVGTYAKYNSGSIKGAWLNLEEYSDKEEFLGACAKLHDDESDPEFMFQDFEGFPRSLYSETSVSDAIWEWLDLDDDDRELLTVFQQGVDGEGDIDRARDAFISKGYNTEADWAAEYLEETGGLEGVPAHLANYIDFESYARDARLGGDVIFVRYEGDLWVFRNG